MSVWQLQEAKARLTECVNQAKLAPQIISRHGKPEVVVLSVEQYNNLIDSKQDIVSFFRSSPLYGIKIPSRDKSQTRKINL